ncbi:PQQ-binding-like beta-propeller repeat protein [Nocardia arthritidis]|uniref:PQQ-binding-like beta-propeller repeat protein n=1 Tax=Nocardia arthritidis TaxID=228602 RepID=A0A6G9YN40_9NOCA|nr:PQQ-binding-like beta-propeller repeat protein [Nocardia arthritidis]QIS14601.1 PQQ-binding-like beta-propeller repeat protein [Nocardia arthritidis]
MGYQGWRSFVSCALALSAVVLVAGCGSQSGTAEPTGSADVPALDSARIQKFDLGKYDAVRMTAAGIVTITGDGLNGYDPRTGEQRWTIRRDGAQVDQQSIWLLDSGHVLLVGWKNVPERIAYDTDSGRELWPTMNPSWSEADVIAGNFVRNDPRTGQRSWSIDPATVGCAVPLPDKPTLFESRDVLLFRCPSKVGNDNDMRDLRIGALAKDTGKVLWQRQLEGDQSIARGPSNVLDVRLGDKADTVDVRTGAVLGTRKRPDSPWRYPLPDGSALAMDSVNLVEDKEFRLVAADGSVKWTAPLQAGEQTLPGPAAQNVILGTMRQRQGDPKATWILAWDLRTAKRTVILGPDTTAQNESPSLRFPVAVDTPLEVWPWGVAVKGTDGSFAVIPAA